MVAQAWAAINRLLQPLYDQVRRVLPAASGLDFAPLFVLLVIYGLRIILVNNVQFFL